MYAAFDHATVSALLRDRRLGREAPREHAPDRPSHLAPFLAVEDHSMLDAEPPRHTRLRALVLRAFTSRQIKGLQPQIKALCHDLIDGFPDDPFDLLAQYCTQIPVIVIARLLGVPERAATDLLRWSHAMVAMYQAGRTRQIEDAAAQAAQEFTAYLQDYIDERRTSPGDDLLTRLIEAEEDGTRLSTDELVGTVILLLNAGHEATVHSLANGAHLLLTRHRDRTCLNPDNIDNTVEEILRYDPPLHMFTRFVYEDLILHGVSFKRGDQIALLLGAANRDPEQWAAPDRFDPTRPRLAHNSFGGGLHFCVGAPLARLEMQIALPILFERCPHLRLSEQATYADSYHFHGLTRLMVTI